MVQDENCYDHGYRGYGEPGVQIDYPWWSWEKREWERVCRG